MNFSSLHYLLVTFYALRDSVITSRTLIPQVGVEGKMFCRPRGFSTALINLFRRSKETLDHVKIEEFVYSPWGASPTSDISI